MLNKKYWIISLITCMLFMYFIVKHIDLYSTGICAVKEQCI